VDGFKLHCDLSLLLFLTRGFFFLCDPWEYRQSSRPRRVCFSWLQIFFRPLLRVSSPNTFSASCQYLSDSQPSSEPRKSVVFLVLRFYVLLVSIFHAIWPLVLSFPLVSGFCPSSLIFFFRRDYGGLLPFRLLCPGSGVAGDAFPAFRFLVF